MQGEDGSRVQVKCAKCNRLYKIIVEQERIELILVQMSQR